MSGALWLLIAAAVPIRAQEAEADLVRRIDSLAPLVEQAAIEAEEAARARLQAARLQAATRRALDTVRVADMTIIAPRPDAQTAIELFAEVWAEDFEGLESRSLSERTFTYQSATYDIAEILVEGVRQQIVVATWHTRNQAKARIRDAIGTAITSELADTELGAWTQGNPFTLRDPAQLYREAVVSGSRAVRRCLDGDVHSCAASLGLELGDDVLEVWYTPEERRTRVLAWAGHELPRWTNLYGTAFDRCVALQAPDACDVFMRTDLDAWTPLPIYMRETLVGLAIDRGGPGAWARLVEDPTMSADEALAYASGVPLDELVAEWRTWVVTHRPEAYAGLGAKGALALIWILFFAATATRSTRWRFA